MSRAEFDRRYGEHVLIPDRTQMVLPNPIEANHDRLIAKEEFSSATTNDFDLDTENTKATHSQHIPSQLLKSLQDAKEHQGAAQLIEFDNKIQAFLDVLRMRLDPNEISYSRYESSATSVLDGAIDNLESIVAISRTTDTSDAHKLQRRIADLEANGIADNIELNTLRDRQLLYEESIEQRNQLIAVNEQALTALTRVTSKLAAVSTKVEPPTNMDYLIKDLRTIADRAERYGKRVITLSRTPSK